MKTCTVELIVTHSLITKLKTMYRILKLDTVSLFTPKFNISNLHSSRVVCAESSYTLFTNTWWKRTWALSFSGSLISSYKPMQ